MLISAAAEATAASPPPPLPPPPWSPPPLPARVTARCQLSSIHAASIDHHLPLAAGSPTARSAPLTVSLSAELSCSTSTHKTAGAAGPPPPLLLPPLLPPLPPPPPVPLPLPPCCCGCGPLAAATRCSSWRAGGPVSRKARRRSASSALASRRSTACSCAALGESGAPPHATGDWRASARSRWAARPIAECQPRRSTTPPAASACCNGPRSCGCRSSASLGSSRPTADGASA